MCELPLPQFPTGIMRGRFSPVDGQLYCCGMFAWSSTQEQPGGLYRVRFTGKPANLPIALHAKKAAFEIVFSDPLDAQAAAHLEDLVFAPDEAPITWVTVVVTWGDEAYAGKPPTP